jgi:hypothetical protein
MKPFVGWTIIIFFLAVIVGGFLLLKQNTSGAASEFSLATTTLPSASNVDHVDRIPSISDRQVPHGNKEYKNNDYHFSVFYPADLPADESHERGYAMTVAFQAKAGEEGFQIYVAPINGTQITEERFLLDEPSGVRKDPVNMSVDGAQAVAFHGFDAKMGQTYEVWFIHNHFLYEISTYKELEGSLNEIMATWRFI